MASEIKTEAELVRLGAGDRFPNARVVAPTPHGFIILSAEIDRRFGPTYALESRTRKRLLRSAKAAAAALGPDGYVVDASVFSAIIAPPGGHSDYLASRPAVHRARFDLVMLIETTTPEAALPLAQAPLLRQFHSDVVGQARYCEFFTASNVRRMGPVDHDRGGVFLFNFFHADRWRQNVDVWQYTAGWFQDQTGLDNSCVLLPAPGAETSYTLINHCRWDRLSDVLPSLLFKPSFRNYVLAHFEANSTAPMPILYRLA